MENKYKYRYLVEDCLTISPGDVSRRFDHMRKMGVSILDGHSNVSYWFDDISRPAFLFVSVDGKEPQKLAWEEIDITFGERNYFYCPCGYRATKLYLPPNGTEFLCRKCHNLRYELTVVNRKSIAGGVIYRMSRLRKLANNRASMSRIFYNGNYTKRFSRFLRLCDRAGLDSIVKGANDLKALIKG